MALEGVGKIIPQLTGIEEINSLISRDGKVSNKIKDTVSINGSKVYDTQLYSLREEIDELKQMVSMLVAKEVLAKNGSSLPNLPINKIDGVSVNKSTNPFLKSANPFVTASFFDSANNANNTPDPNKPKTDEELIKDAIRAQIKAQMDIKAALLDWDTTLMREKKDYEIMLSAQQHQTKLVEMTMAAFNKVREMNEQMWLNLKQKEDQLDQQRVKVLGGF